MLRRVVGMSTVDDDRVHNDDTPARKEQDNDSAFKAHKIVFCSRAKFDRYVKPPKRVTPVYLLFFKLGKLLGCIKRDKRLNRAKTCNLSVFGLPVVGPLNPWLLTWLAVIDLWDATYTAFGIPLLSAFSNHMEQVSWLNSLIYVGGIIYLIDMLVHFQAGFVASWRGKHVLVRNGYQVAEIYVLRGTFFLDVLSVLPTLIRPVVDAGTYKDLQLLRLLRLVRLPKLAGSLRRLIMLPQSGSEHLRHVWKVVSSGLLYGLLVAYFTLFVLNLLACSWYGVSRIDQTASWLASVRGDQDLVDASWVDQYVASVYFAATTATTVGYGDITATTSVERIVSIIVEMAGVVVFGTVIAMLNQVVFGNKSKKSQYDSMLQARLEEVDAFLTDYGFKNQGKNSVSARTKAYVRRHVVAGCLAEDMDALFNKLPPPLRSEIAMHMMGSIKNHPRIAPPEGSKMNEDDFLMILMHAELVDVAAYFFLWVQGDQVEHVTLLQEGHVELFFGSKLVHTVHAPAWIGEADVIASGALSGTGATYACTAMAIGACQTWRIPLRALRLMALENPQVLGQLSKLMSSTLRNSPAVEISSRRGSFIVGKTYGQPHVTQSEGVGDEACDGGLECDDECDDELRGTVVELTAAGDRPPPTSPVPSAPAAKALGGEGASAAAGASGSIGGGGVAADVSNPGLPTVASTGSRGDVQRPLLSPAGSVAGTAATPGWGPSAPP